MNPQGKVSNIMSEKVVYKPVVNLPVITVQEALDKLVTETAPAGVIEAQKTPYTFPDMEFWIRTYEAGEQVFLYGYVSVYQPVSPFGTNLLTLGNIKLELPVPDLEHAALERPGKLFQIWGEMSDSVTLQVVGWQDTPILEEHLIGLIKLKEGKFYLYSGADRLLLVDAPDDIALDTEVRICGIRLNSPEPAFEWSYIEAGVQPTGGGGGGGGATVFREITLTGPAESAQETVTLTSTPEIIYQPGMLIDGVEGPFYLALERYANGSESKRMFFYPTQQESLPEVYEVRLNGGELDGIDQFHTLPIRLWGTVIEFKENIFTLDVSRYEAVYPGLDVQAWLGTWELVELGGKNVIRFQDQQGQQYLLASSLLYEQTEFAGFPGDLVILEGLQIPGNMYEGLPVIEERSGIMVEIGQTSLEGYQLVSKEINVIENQQLVGGRLTIDNIELVYLASDLRFGPLEPGQPPMYIQPGWRFSGHYDDGRKVVILI